MVLLGSSTAKWLQDTQRLIEEAVHKRTNTYIKMDIQKRVEKFTNLSNTQDQTTILWVHVPTEHSDLAADSLCHIFAQGVPSTVGRRMRFFPTRDRSSISRAKLNKLMIRQKNLNVR